MKIDVREIEFCRMAVVYEADAEQILSKRAEVMDAFKKAPVPGFRPGKATVEAIRAHYRTQIEESLKRGLVEDAYHNTLFEKKFRPHGAPRITSAIMDGGKFACEFELFIKPNIELNSYKNLEIPKPPEVVSETELAEKMLQELRIKFGEAAPYEENDFVQKGDNILIDYDGYVDGERVDNLCAVGEMLTVGNSQLDAFDDNLLGMTLGDTREFSVIVPPNGLPSLAGKKVDFKVTLNMGSKNVPCPLDNTLAEKLGRKDLDELRGFVRGSATARSSEANKKAILEAMVNKLLADNVFTVPNWLSISEAQYLAHQAKLNWDDVPDVDKEKFIELGERNVRLALILDKIREDEPDAQLTDQEVFDMIKQNLAKTKVQTSLDDVIKEMDRTGYLQILFSRIRDEHTLDFIIKSIQFIE